MEINWIGEILDIIFALLGKVGRVFNNYGKKICFIIWAFVCCYWVARNIYLNLYAQSFFCIVSICMHIHGWFTWKKRENKS